MRQFVVSSHRLCIKKDMDSGNTFSIIKFLNTSIDFNEYEDQILKPFTYLCESSHKWKDLFLASLKHWMEIPDDKTKSMNEILELVLGLPIIIDDIIDDGKLSRGRTAPHIVYGVPATIICCQYGNVKLHEKILNLNNEDLFQLYIETGLVANYGQALDVYWRENFLCPSFSDYIMMIKAKSGVSLKFVADVVQAFSENKTNYNDIVVLMGIFVQFLNDYRNLFQSENSNKDEIFADDLTEGKFSLPLVHAINVMQNKEVAEILKQRPKDLETKRRCVKILQEIGTQAYCKNVLDDTKQVLKEKIKNVGGNPVLEVAMDILSSAYQ